MINYFTQFAYFTLYFMNMIILIKRVIQSDAKTYSCNSRVILLSIDRISRLIETFVPMENYVFCFIQGKFII